MSSAAKDGVPTGQRAALLSDRLSRPRPSTLVHVHASSPSSPVDAKSDAKFDGYVSETDGVLVSPAASAGAVRASVDAKAVVPFVSPQLSIAALVQRVNQLCATSEGREFAERLVEFCLRSGKLNGLVGAAAAIDTVLGSSWRDRRSGNNMQYKFFGQAFVVAGPVAAFFNDCFNTVTYPTNVVNLCDIGPTVSTPSQVNRQSNKIYYKHFDFRARVEGINSIQAGRDPQAVTEPGVDEYITFIVVVDTFADLSNRTGAGYMGVANPVAVSEQVTGGGPASSNDSLFMMSSAAAYSGVVDQGLSVMRENVVACGPRFKILHRSIHKIPYTRGVAGPVGSFNTFDLGGHNTNVHISIPLGFMGNFSDVAQFVPFDTCAYLLWFSTVASNSTRQVSVAFSALVHWEDKGVAC